MTVAWNTVGALSYAAAAAAIILRFTGCADYPTNFSGSESSSVPVIRPPHNGGCVPEVFSSSTDSTETVMTTFTAVVTTEIGCYPNLTAWGIDMADGVGVDTPQGDGYFQIRYHEIVNPPSAGLAAVGAPYTPPQVMVEFDPPVQSVEFYYSRRAGALAWWGGMVNTDSTAVSVRSRIPGTTFYQTYQRQVLYSNSSATAYDGWDSVRFQAPSDLIQWLWIDGRMAVDNFKVTRRPLVCSPSSVQRGQQLTCRVTPGTGWTVTSWEFVPEGAGGTAAALRRDPESGTEDLLLMATSNSALPNVVENTSSRVWAGPVGVGGTVRVYLTDGSATKTHATQFTVTDRPSPWASKQSYREGTYNTFRTAVDAEPSNVEPGAILGANCDSALGCSLTFRLQPDPATYLADRPESGVVLAPFPDGANKGYWHVKSAAWNMRRIGNVNPAIRIESPRTHPSLPTTKKCNKSTTLRNFYRYSQDCRGLNVADFVAGALAHEGMGRNGGRGHEGLARVESGKPENDPYAVHYEMIEPDSVTLVDQVQTTAMGIAERLTYRSDDDPTTESDYLTPGGN